MHVVTDWQQRVAAGLRSEEFEGELLPPSLLLQESFGAAGSFIVALPPSSGINLNILTHIRSQTLKGGTCKYLSKQKYLLDYFSLCNRTSEFNKF